MNGRRCPRAGARVKFAPNPAARQFYDAHTPKPGSTGTVTTVPVPGGRKTCFPGPRGGMVYVEWDGGHVEGVFRADLVRSARRGGKPLAGAKENCDPRELRRQAEAQGWRVEPTKGGHWRFAPPDPTKRLVVTSGTPSDARAIRNMVADLKRSGLKTNCR